jgi:hypothetical protein
MVGGKNVDLGGELRKGHSCQDSINISYIDERIPEKNKRF